MTKEKTQAEILAIIDRKLRIIDDIESLLGDAPGILCPLKRVLVDIKQEIKR